MLYSTHHIRIYLIYLFPDSSSFSLPSPTHSQPRTQASSRYPSDQRGLGTLTSDVTYEITEDDWERG